MDTKKESSWHWRTTWGLSSHTIKTYRSDHGMVNGTIGFNVLESMITVVDIKASSRVVQSDSSCSQILLRDTFKHVLFWNGMRSPLLFNAFSNGMTSDSKVWQSIMTTIVSRWWRKAEPHHHYFVRFYGLSIIHILHRDGPFSCSTQFSFFESTKPMRLCYYWEVL